MPELPEVETARRKVERALKGKTLVEVLPHRGDTIVFDRASPTEFRTALLGAKVIGSGRRGKYFWLKLDRRPWPIFHLGMSGNVEIRKLDKNFAKAWGGLKLWRGTHVLGKKTAPGPDAPPRFCRLRLITEDGIEVAITDPRRFGRIRLAQDPLAEPPVSKLGYDPLEKFPSSVELKKILASRHTSIKALLLNQALFAGVGNWIADEVLYQARIAPKRRAAELSLTEVARLRTKLLQICRHAVKVHANYERFPRTWLFHHRWGRADGAQTARGAAIVHETIGGRTTAWVPARQR